MRDINRIRAGNRVMTLRFIRLWRDELVAARGFWFFPDLTERIHDHAERLGLSVRIAHGVCHFEAKRTA